jgi:hypothetical protein
MQSDQSPRIHMCANRFELISSWGEPVDKAWARDMFERWLDQRVDLTDATVYDSGVLTKGDNHG